MRRLVCMAAVVVMLILVMALSGCSSSKYLEPDEYLLSKVSVSSDS